MRGYDSWLEHPYTRAIPECPECDGALEPDDDGVRCTECDYADYPPEPDPHDC